MHRGFRTEPCFVCRMVAGDIRFPENIIHEDEHALVFLDGYPRAYGYTLVVPKEHREQVTGTSPWRSTSTCNVSSTASRRQFVRRLGQSGCTFSPSVPTRATPTPTGMSCLCRPASPTRISRTRGRAGVRACSRSRKMRWRPWPRASGEGSGTKRERNRTGAPPAPRGGRDGHRHRRRGSGPVGQG